MSKPLWWGTVRCPGVVVLLGCTIAMIGGLAPGAAARAATLPPGDTGVVDASGDTGTPQTEQTMAVDPSDPRNVMIAEIGDCLSVSHDGGRTWKLNNVYNNCTADNNPAFDSHGVAYFYIDDGGLFKSTDHGDTFAPGVRIAGNNGGDIPDRPWFVVDQSPGPSNGTEYLSYESFFTNPLGWIYEVSSADGFKEHRVDDMTNYPATQDPRNYPVVGADGTLYIAYAEGHAGFLIPQQSQFPISFVVARSSDHGATFKYAFAATNITRSSAPTEESEAISSLAADPSPLRAGHLALAWADQRTGTSRILLTDSVDGGVTWSKPVDVTGDPIPTDNQDHVQVRFLPDGRIAMVWRDRRCCGGGFSNGYNLYARTIAMSDTGALDPGPVVQVTDSPQQPNTDPNFDEYLGFAAGPEGLSVAWNQPLNGVAATYYRRMPLSEFGIPPLAPPSRAAALKISIDATRAQVRRRATRVKLHCSGGAAHSVCRGMLSIVYRGPLARASYAVATGKTASVLLHLSPKARGMLERARGDRRRVSARATVRGGAQAQRRIVLVLDDDDYPF